MLPIHPAAVACWLTYCEPHASAYTHCLDAQNTCKTPGPLRLQECRPLCQQLFPRGFASDADNSKIDTALEKAIESHDAQQLLKVS